VSREVRRVSPTSLAIYAACPRQYQYDKDWRVNSPEESRRYLDRGLAYHAAIEDVCRVVSERAGQVSDEWIQQRAMDAIEARWQEMSERREYVSDAQYAYDHDLAAAAVQDYFENDGLEHARHSLDQEVWLECDHGDVHLLGRADNIVRTDYGLQVIDYKGKLDGIISGASQGKLVSHAKGDEYAADVLKSVFQAATYIEGAKATEYFEPGMSVEFTFYGLLQSPERTRHLDGIQVSVSGRSRDVGWLYAEYEDTIWGLIEAAYEGILTSSYEPEPWDLIREHACEDCGYRAMCGDYLGAEVGVGE